MRKMSVAESLEEFAERTYRTTEAAYPEWHEHGNAVAKAYAVPFLDHVTVAGGKCFGLYPPAS